MLLYSFFSILLINLISLIGALTVAIDEKKLKNILLYLVSFSTGGLFGGTFFHLLPETIEMNGGNIRNSFCILGGILFFFLIEKFIHWRHCHIPTSKEHPHPVAYMNLLGDLVHNMIDGLLIGGSYLVSISLGISTTLAVIFHEIPQEIGDFGVLLHGGFSKKKALLLNFCISFSAFAGMFIAIFIGKQMENFVQFLLPFTAGGFIYIACSDLIPELHKESKTINSIFQIVWLFIGIGLMYLLSLQEV